MGDPERTQIERPEAGLDLARACAAPREGKVIVYWIPEFRHADASKRAAAFAASKVSAVPLTIRSISLLSVFDLRWTSHVGTLSCVKTNNMHSSTSANSAGLGHSGGSGFHSISSMRRV
jgi:uncharacterized protein with WD repeat